MREVFIEELIKEVLGPRYGVNEIMEHDPLNEYLTGILIPRDINLSVPDDDQFDKNTGESDEYDDSFSENFETIVSSDLDPRLRSKSFGISFIVNSETPIIDICVTWARYSINDKVWERTPYYKIFNDFKFDKTEICLYDKSDGKIMLNVKKRELKNLKNHYHITLSMVNELIPSDINFADSQSSIFQPSIRIKQKNAEIDDINILNKKNDELSFLYRDRKILAKGHMVSAIWEEIDYEEIFKDNFGITLWEDGDFFAKNDDNIKEFFNPHIRTEFIPLHPMPLPNFDIFEEDADLFSAKYLSECWDKKDLKSELDPLIEEYEKWINIQEKESSKINDFGEIPHKIIENQKVTLDRIKLGLDSLMRDENARLAFCFANRCICLQYKWSKKKTDFKWRAFQLAFILMSIESIIEKNSEFRNTLDLLWISTGGGKTEAYLGIMAFTMAYRRLNNQNYCGTSIISRYTLRLLTIQQFNRSLLLVTAAEYLRIFSKDNMIGWRPQKCTITKDWLYGSSQFSIGMWVGSPVTPNSLREDHDGAIQVLSKENSIDSNPAQVIRCPSCGNWLSIPDEGLPAGEKLNIVIKLFDEDIEKIKSYLEDKDNVIEVTYSNKNHKQNFYTISIQFSDKIMTVVELDSIFKDSEDLFEVASLHYLNPGYFGKNKINDTFHDFEIICTNPDKCDLNDNHGYWCDSSPLNSSKNLDGLYEKEEDSVFINGSRIRIPALTVDEQIYHQCPTVIIATADKIARLAFEPRISAIFGNVSLYNRFSGYCKNNNITSFPKKLNLKKYRKDEDTVEVENFLPPDLIIQDELHLIDGPLGSLFGIYETAMSSIIKRNDGNPKYIASSATIKNAVMQCKYLFAKEVSQFPPYGLNIEDNFFVQESPIKDAWDDSNFGRVYAGIYSPGRGPLTPLIRIWANILNTSYNNQNKEGIKFYWTIVGYFNAIRELGGGVALYREDIGERLKNISSKRIISDENTIELSSRLSSTEVPLELNKLEIDGKNIKPSEKPSYDAIFTTSMFGTGVDISHLGIMIVNGQPKTTGSYIQATGRIGRSFGGLVVPFLRAGRPRDLDHYENFSSYHYKIHSNIEPISVSPFSKGALDQAAGSSMVSYLRNSFNMYHNWDEDAQISEDCENDFNSFFDELTERLNIIYDDKKKINLILREFKAAKDRWFFTANNSDNLYFTEYLPFTDDYKKDIVLGDGIHEKIDDLQVVYENVPNSLREIEESTNFWVRKYES